MKVCIFGQKENGKTTVANILSKQLMSSGLILNHHIYKFSQPLRDIFKLVLNKDDEWIENNKNTKPSKWKHTLREGMQKLSDNIKSIAYPDILMDMLFDRIKDNNYIIDDGRHYAEAIKNHENRGFNILIIRPSHVNSDPHSSESWLGDVVRNYIASRQLYTNDDLFDCIILNNGTLEDLHRKVINMKNGLENY